MVNYYEQENLWNKELTSQEAERLHLVSEIIPSGIKTILDVGCGNGALTNNLDGNRYEITGIDRSKEALKHYKYNKVEGSVDNLPFADNAFDLVICSDVLEHLPSDILEKTIDELKRVSGKYLLIISPNNEELLQNSTQCKQCKTIYHINDHLHSFDLNKLKEMFEDTFSTDLVSYFGDRWNFKDKSIIDKAHKMGIFIKYENSVCPQCGLKSNITDFNAIDNSTELLNELDIVKFKEFNEKCEILILFKKVKKENQQHYSWINNILKRRYRFGKLYLQNINQKKPYFMHVHENVLIPEYKQFQVNNLELSPVVGKIIINENMNWHKDKKVMLFKNNKGIDNHAVFIFPSKLLEKYKYLNIEYIDTISEELIVQVWNSNTYETIGIFEQTNDSQKKNISFELPVMKTIKNHTMFRLISSTQKNFEVPIARISLVKEDSNTPFYDLKVQKKEIKLGKNEHNIFLSENDMFFDNEKNDIKYFIYDKLFYQEEFKENS